MRKRKQQEAACRVEFPVCYRMDHFREERLWVRSHIQILQLKPYGRSGHLNFFICNETKQGMATPPQNTQLLQGHFFKNSELLRASHALEMVFSRQRFVFPDLITWAGALHQPASWPRCPGLWHQQTLRTWWCPCNTKSRFCTGKSLLGSFSVTSVSGNHRWSCFNL